jgi:hypothetical protein
MYDPANSVEVEPEFIEQVDEIDINLNDIVDDGQLALSNERIIQQLTGNERWQSLSDKDEYRRLTAALMDRFEY